MPPYYAETYEVFISKELTTKHKYYEVAKGIEKRKCKVCKKFYYPSTIHPKGLKNQRCVDCWTDLMFDPRTTTLDQF